MAENENSTAPSSALGDYNLVGGAGGSRAILATAGTILACHQAGISQWRTVGGASGGSVPTVMLAAGMHPTKIVRLTIELDFASMLTRHGSLVKVLLAFIMKDRYEKTRPRRGVLSSEKLGLFIDQMVPSWPKSYWTVATVGELQWLLNAEGAYRYDADGGYKLICPPLPLSLAIRATCAVPGIIDAVPCQVGSRVRYLFDGAFGIDGRCPIGVAKRFYKQDAGRIIACDVGEEQKGKREKHIRNFWKIICGEGCLREPEGDDPRHAEGIVLVKPAATSVRSLQFTLSRDQKWEAVMSGYAGAATQLAAAGIMTAHKLGQALDICRSFQELADQELPDGQLAEKTALLLSGYGLY